MSVSSDSQPAAPLGVGAIIADSFSIFFGDFFKVLALGFVPAFGGVVISGFISGWDVTLGTATPDPADFAVLPQVLTFIATTALWGIGVALLVQLAYDAKHGRSRPLGQYFGPAINAAIPIAVLSMVGAIIAGLGFMLLIVPGLWVYGAISVLAPAVVFDKVGFGGLGRSFNLTKGYRWPIIGVLIVIGLCTVLINFAAIFVSGLLLSVLGSGGVVLIVSLIVVAFVYALVYGLSGISVALIYARLREIKEGTQISELAAVFD